MLHVALLFGPTFLIAALVGRKPAAVLALILAMGTEAAEYAFGFGFDSLDACDLGFDVIGIALALLAYLLLQRVALRRIAPWLRSGGLATSP